MKIIVSLFSTIVIVCSACSSENQTTREVAPLVPPNQETQTSPVSMPLPKDEKSISFKNFGIIREFGGTDNAALFGLLSDAGKYQITNIWGPEFLEQYTVGELNRTTIDKVFLNTTKPLSQEEREALLSDFNGATLIYLEGYNGNLCNQTETKYEITTKGTLNDIEVQVIFEFEALPNMDGNCSFHIFGIVVRYVN